MKELTVTSGLVLTADIPTLLLEEVGIVKSVEYFLMCNEDEKVQYLNGYISGYPLVSRLHIDNPKSISIIDTSKWPTDWSIDGLKGVEGIALFGKNVYHPAIIVERGFKGYIDIAASFLLTNGTLPEGISPYEFKEADTLLEELMGKLRNNAKYWVNEKHKSLKISKDDLKEFADSVTFGVLTTLDPCSEGEVYDLVTQTHLEERLQDIYYDRPFVRNNIKLLNESGQYEFHDNYYQ